MALIISPINLLKDVFTVAEGIKNLVEGATFLKNRSEQLADHVEDVLQQLEPLKNRPIDASKPDGLNKFLSKLFATLNDCQELISKCQSMGKFSAGLRSLTQKASFTERFDRLEKKLERMNLPATLVNMVSIDLCQPISYFCLFCYNITATVDP